MKNGKKYILDWIDKNASRLREQSPNYVAEEFSDLLCVVDERLGVEVARDSDSGIINIIITAYSEPSLFDFVKEVVSDVGKIDGFVFTALKPARGFLFSLNFGEKKMRASDLRFIPMSDVDLGFILLVENEIILNNFSEDYLEELAWLIVETGIGEELASRIQHLEFSVLKNGESFRIQELANYINNL